MDVSNGGDRWLGFDGFVGGILDVSEGESLDGVGVEAGENGLDEALRGGRSLVQADQEMVFGGLDLGLGERSSSLANEVDEQLRE